MPKGAAVDGQAYYWSSVDPTSNATGNKLAAMAAAVRCTRRHLDRTGRTGFDARLVGGMKRCPGVMGRRCASPSPPRVAPEPDAIGLISWNEFSENTHVEPSKSTARQRCKRWPTSWISAPRSSVPGDSSDTTVRHGD